MLSMSDHVLIPGADITYLNSPGKEVSDVIIEISDAKIHGVSNDVV